MIGLPFPPPCQRRVSWITHVLLLAACSTVPHVGRAQVARPADALDLQGAMRLARETAPGLRAADARRDVALGRAREAGQFLNPTIEYRRENLGSVLSPDIFATLYLPFDVTGRRLAMRRTGGAATDRASADGVADRRDAELRVARAWVRTAAAGEQVLIARALADALMEVARTDSTRAREGLIADGAALRSRLEADRVRVALSAAVGDLARARARGELAEATAWRDEVAIGVRADAIAALTAYLEVRSNAADAATFAPRGREVASIARAAYREGHASLVELLDAERAAADAMSAHLRWIVDAWLTRLELERAVGVRLDTDSPLDLPLRAALPSTSR